MASLFPVFIDIEGRKVTVVGAGRIAARRTAVLVDFGAKVTVIAPCACREIVSLAEEGKIEWIRMAYSEGMTCVRESFFVLSATDDAATERLVYDECKSLGIPVNLASDRTMCDFYFPGIAKGAGVTAGITAGGEDHRLAAGASQRVRDLLAQMEEEAARGGSV